MTAHTPHAAHIYDSKLAEWAVLIGSMAGVLMQALDTTIANVALPYMQGELSASRDQVTWVLTSYLVSNAIILPMSAWLARLIGRKRFYMTCVAVFTLSSFACGIAPTLGLLVLFRVMQGIGGGGLQPSEQAILADTFPHKRAVRSARVHIGIEIRRRTRAAFFSGRESSPLD